MVRPTSDLLGALQDLLNHILGGLQKVPLVAGGGGLQTPLTSDLEHYASDKQQTSLDRPRRDLKLVISRSG